MDVLVVFDPAYPVGFRISEMEEELSSLFGGRQVDIVNEKYLNRRLRARILDELRFTTMRAGDDIYVGHMLDACHTRAEFDADENLRLALTHLGSDDW